ncbi:unnamed protein product [Phytomonas sp. EM1]|nr:unnamed protein product [Phytomonas sp. EM1]|eukprot:CCW60762.1 unnamed protein product [Phytomonas sp. isolate EM1]
MTTDYRKTVTTYIAPQDEEKLIDRLYTRSIERKKAIIEESERRFYPVAEPTKISAEQLQKSIERQVYREMARRQARAQEADASLYGPNNGAAARSVSGKGRIAAQTLTNDEVADSVLRLYNQSLERRKANMSESENRYLFHPPESKKLPKGEIQEYINKMSQPRKREYTIDEINKIYGFM